MNALDFDYIKKFLLQQSAIVLDSGKEYLIESRLLPVAKKEGFSTLEEFIQHLRTNPVGPNHHKVVDAMTTNETLFFRDVHPFEVLKDKVLPEIISKRCNEKKLNIWCAASSSGQEPYTIAMILKEHFPILQDWKITFIASDISDSMLERSRLGIYNQLEVNRGLPIIYLAKYFHKVQSDWQIKEPIRKMIEFKKINLIGLWPSFLAFDVVFIRNVMIYFDVETKKTILKKIRENLKSDGYLFLGGAETTMGLDSHFERTKFEKTACYQLAGKK